MVTNLGEGMENTLLY